MTGVRELTLPIQYRSFDRMFQFRFPEKLGNVEMKVCDQDHMILKKLTLKRGDLERLNPEMGSLSSRDIVQHLLSKGYKPAFEVGPGFTMVRGALSFRSEPMQTLEMAPFQASEVMLFVVPSGGLALSGRYSLRVWDLQQDGKLSQAPRKYKWGRDIGVHASSINLPSGLTVTGHPDGTIKIWDPNQNCKCVKTLNAHAKAVYALCLLQNGLFASGSSDTSIKIWDPKRAFACVRELSGHRLTAWQIRVLLDGRFASRSAEDIKIWDPKQDYSCTTTLKIASTWFEVLRDGCITVQASSRTMILDPKNDFQVIRKVEERSSFTVLDDGSVAVRYMLPRSGLMWDERFGVQILDPKQSYKSIQNYTEMNSAIVFTDGLQARINLQRDGVDIFDSDNNYSQALEGHSGQLEGITALAGGSLAGLFDDGRIEVWGRGPPCKPMDISSVQESIQWAIDSLQKVTLTSNNPDHNCAICLEIFKDPVITNCGHTFCKEHITKYLTDYRDKCPSCRAGVHSLQPNYAIAGTIDHLRKEKSDVPTFLLFKGKNSELEQTYRSAAQLCEREKQYAEALFQYSALLKYSRDWKDYSHIPRLMDQMGQGKAIVTYLYLARYQLEAKAYSRALLTLKRAASLNELAQPAYFHCQILSGDAQQRANGYLGLAKGVNDSKAIALCRKAIEADPLYQEAYLYLVSLLKKTHHKAHLLVKAAFHLTQSGDLNSAESLCKQAYQLCPKAPLDTHRLYFWLLVKQRRLDQAKELYLALAKSYIAKEQALDRIECYRHLLWLSASNEIYYKEIVAAYQQLQNRPGVVMWTLKWIATLTESKEWEKAEAAINAALVGGDELTLLKALEVIYNSWNSHKLSDLWTRLGEKYQAEGELASAEAVYRKACDRFHEVRHSLALAKVLVALEKVSEGVQLYSRVANASLLKNDLPSLEAAVKAIRAVDPTFSHLSKAQRLSLEQNYQIVNLRTKVTTLSNKVESLEKQLQAHSLK
jgi:WD40 repeat protein